MARKDIIRGANQVLEEMQENAPDFLRLANEAINAWGSSNGKIYLVSAVAEKLQQVYQLGLERSPLPAPQEPEIKRRARPVVTPQPEATTRVMRRRSGS